MRGTGLCIDADNTHLALLKIQDAVYELEILDPLILRLVHLYVVLVVLVAEPMIYLSVWSWDGEHRKITLHHRFERLTDGWNDGLVESIYVVPACHSKRYNLAPSTSFNFPFDT